MIVTGTVTYAAPAAAQATRTWVSGVGDDVNPCSRTAPCKTFAGAISKTAAGGEINCIDQGAYGAVTITKSISIYCEGVTAGVLHSATNGIIINAAATDVINLKGLDINGGTPSAAGLNGVRFLNGGSLTIENCLIRNSLAGTGIAFQPAGAARLAVINSTISNNGTASAGGGILVQPTGTGSARVVIESTRIVNNVNQAIRVDTTGNTGPGNQVTVVDSVLSENAFGVVVVTPAATTLAVVSVVDSTVAHNSNTGIVANGGTAQVRVSGTTITGNGAGGAGQGGLFVGAGGNIATYGDNRLFGNAPDGAFTAGPLPKN
ncbi:right-handed parallel beta-helix repeat-containing protein [Sphingomonas psychrotolerans]|uniref:Right-handed parallel beta-helix repeat-containing protein n=1 Tax=Sphingomonas psychrotolerans TaxID=1327635 RepID=A0ABU3N5D5_9SPHN|nr:right-handed parallel beta-helix repeat-containing protein [Sphingomonas psychrotolerans]MDT8759748.1 right-handed parallel beta-helix repeat-containing protein [Sphingomonas psychrotolerans]